MVTSFLMSTYAAQGTESGGDIPMQYPKLSIITPSLNQVDFIEQTICSVLDQGYPCLEYIIIDGGSTDGTLNVIGKYSRYLAYWVSEPDGGQSQAINKGLHASTGALVGWQNSDDYYLPGSFHKVANAFHTVDADVYYGHKYNVDTAGQIMRAQCYVPYSLHSNVYEGMVMANQSAFWRKELLEQVGYLDEKLHYAMDYEFFLRLGVSGFRFCLINDWLGCLRVHGGTKSLQFGDRWEQELHYADERNGIRRSAVRLNRALSRVRRLYYYIHQGNLSYLVSGIWRRFKQVPYQPFQ